MTQTTEAQDITNKLSQPMIEMLRNGFYGEGSSTIIAGHRNPTRKALVRRGLVHDDNRWTVLGREVARAIDPRIKTLDELHALALDEDGVHDDLAGITIAQLSPELADAEFVDRRPGAR